MNLFRSTIFALSVALMFSVGASSSATTNHSHPAFSVSEDRALNLRETGSQMVVDTIEDALRSGGLALFDERFQLDSSLSWVFGETIEGEVDAVVPLWGKGKHAFFVQPGAVFWTGFEEEERIDGNLGLVYRREMAADVIGGVSLFYDHDFQIGHQRIGVGVDVQRGGFHGAFNYYRPITDTQDGREGYIEDALQGMDVSLAIGSEVTLLGANAGYWKFQGDEEIKDDWKFSFGLDAGLRIVPGVFLEGSLQRHDKDVSLGQRASVGLAFRFSLPGLKGKSYGDDGRVLSLYKPVARDKRILYEERESDGILLTSDRRDIEEGGTVNVAVSLRKPSAEDLTLNLIGSGSAEYGSSNDWVISVGGTECASVTETSCQITIAAGETTASDNVVITINDDGRTNEPDETIVLSITVASGDATLTSSPLPLTILADPPLPTVSLRADSTSIMEGNTATLTLTLSEDLDENATFNLISGGTEATYGTDADWNLSVGGTDCAMATGTMCQVTIDGDGINISTEVTVEINTDSTNEGNETFTVSVEVDSASMHLVQAGDAASLLFTIPANAANNIKFTSSTLTVTEGGSVTAPAGMNKFAFPQVVLSNVLPAGIEITLVISGNAEDGDYGLSAALNQINSNGAEYDADTGVWTLPSGVTDPTLVFEATQETSSPDTDNEEIIIQLTDPNNNLPTGWSIVEPSTLTITIVDEG